MSQLAIYSGKVRQCAIGVATPFRDMRDAPLSTGDIVVIYSDNGFVDPMLTCVIGDDDGFWVMGIKSVPLDEPGYWRVYKVKDHIDAVDGEHWKAFGFSFRSESAA